MTQAAIIEIALFVLAVLIFVKPLGAYITFVYERKPCKIDQFIKPIENCIYRLASINPEKEMTWKQYLFALVIFNATGFVFLFLILILQGVLPWNPQNFTGLHPDLAFNTAVSFITNTDWQAYAGENTMSYFSDMLGLTVQNFLSAASGIAVLFAMMRGFTRIDANTIGNFWVDLSRAVLYILLPLALLFAILLMSQGVIQNLHPYLLTHALDTSSSGLTQTLPMGPVASQEAIKLLGTNGGGFFNVNAAHPFANPTPCSNFLEMLAMLLIPAALCYSLGRAVHDSRQGWAILLAMLLLFVPFTFLNTYLEQSSPPGWQSLNITTLAAPGLAPGGNMVGKEERFGITDSSLFTVSATATATGASNASFDSMTPMAGFVPLFMMHMGEVVFGGVGIGLCSMIIMILIAVFVAGLMVGRTPEYLGKKIEPFEMKMAALFILLMPTLVLASTALTLLNPAIIHSLENGGAHGLTEVLYNFTSMANNNGSAFGGINMDTPFLNILGAFIMAAGRFAAIAPLLAIAGSLARKKNTPVGPGTLPTHSGFFIGLLVMIVLIIGGLTFIPALALGPIVEQLQMFHL